MTSLLISGLLGLLTTGAGADADFPPLFPATLSYLSEVNEYGTQEPRSIMRPLNSYDFVIVGAGSAGCVMANRLSEIADWKILLIEAGREESFLMDIPLLANVFQFTDINWKYKSQPSKSYCLGMRRNQCHVPRGKVMGGSSVLNYMIYNRGHHKDYDQWEALGNPGWGYRHVLPYFRKLENAELGPGIDLRYRNRGGYMSASEILTRTPVAEAFVAAGQELGFSQLDYNAQYQQGFSFHQVTMKNGTRMSTSRAYLHPIRDRKNLHVLKSGMVTKVIMDEQSKRAKGVEVLLRGKIYHITAHKEVILSAGAINSPQLLMLSGIGPQRDLKELGIKPLADLAVGYNLMDHVALGGMTFLAAPNTTLLSDRLMNDPRFLYDFFNHHGGLATIPGGTEALGFVDLQNPRDPDGHPDLELLLTSSTLAGDDTIKESFAIKDSLFDTVYKPIKGQDGFMIFPMVLRPKSKGRVSLRFANPLTPPNIEMGYFSDERDLDVLVEGVRYSRRLINSEAFRHIQPKLHRVPLPGCKQHQFDSDSYWKCHARHLSFTIYHQSGTCKMGPAADPSAVLDHRLRVHKVTNLRVVDASMFPEIPASHPNVIVIMVAEKASDMIKEDWSRAN